MKELRWDIKKNERLKITRGVSFEDLISSKIVGIVEHHARKNQKIMLFEFKKYIWAVPFVKEEDYYFLKTLFPSRKYTKQIKGDK